MESKAAGQHRPPLMQTAAGELTRPPPQTAYSLAPPLKVLCILGHPRGDSLCGALFRAFIEGALYAGCEVRKVEVANLCFDPDLHTPSPDEQNHENDVCRVQSLISWADHLVFVYPTWWGVVPARLKGLLDRCLTPGFAFRHRNDGSVDKLLDGKTAQLLTTMDTPTWVYRSIYGSPGFRMLERATLGYCGVRSVRRTVFSPVVESSASSRRLWLAKAWQEGQRLVIGPLTPTQKQCDRLLNWVRALRLQFYPMSFVAYLIGALGASGGATGVDKPRFWIGYLALFLLEAATVFVNEYFDNESDKLNKNAGPFNGGSRVLVLGTINHSTLMRTAVICAFGYAAIVAWLTMTSPWPTATLLWLALLGIAAIGYTAPPLSLSHRSLGELDVAFTHSIGVMMVGNLLQGGAIHDPLPWLLSLPLGLSVLPAIMLSGLPDYEADQAVGKRTLAVRLGKTVTVRLAILSTLLAVFAAGLIMLAPLVRDTLPVAILPIVAIHAALIVVALTRRLRNSRLEGRIDAVMLLTLSYCIWFGLLPLSALW